MRQLNTNRRRGRGRQAHTPRFWGPYLKHTTHTDKVRKEQTPKPKKRGGDPTARQIDKHTKRHTYVYKHREREGEGNRQTQEDRNMQIDRQTSKEEAYTERPTPGNSKGV